MLFARQDRARRAEEVGPAVEVDQLFIRDDDVGPAVGTDLVEIDLDVEAGPPQELEAANGVEPDQAVAPAAVIDDDGGGEKLRRGRVGSETRNRDGDAGRGRADADAAEVRAVQPRPTRSSARRGSKAGPRGGSQGLRSRSAALESREGEGARGGGSRASLSRRISADRTRRSPGKDPRERERE